MTDDSFWSTMGYVLLFALAIAVGLGPLSCPNNERARDVLKAEGYTHIKTSGAAGTFACGGDGSATGFTATGPTGRHVSGAVCCGIVFKACTVRVEHVREVQ